MTFQELVNKINFKKILPTKKKHSTKLETKLNAKQIHSPKHCNVQLMKLCERLDQRFICHELQSEHDSPK